jgi:hypothetical protein
MTRLCRRGAGLLGLALGIVFLSSAGGAADDKDSPGVPVSEAEFKKLVDGSVKTVQGVLKGTPDRKALNKARTAAVMIAAFAQYAKTEGGDKTALREAGLKLYEAIRGNKLDEARQLVESIAKGVPEGGAAKEGGIMARLELEPGEVMRQFAAQSAGGNGGEALLKKMTAITKRELPAKDMNDDFVLLALRIATMAELMKEHKPSEDPKAWPKFAEELRKNGLDLAEQARKKNGSAAFARVYEVTLTCNKCHKKYRGD